MSVFQSNKSKGEIIRLREMLDSNSPEDRKRAAKRVVALMRAGENLSQLFASMQRCVRTDDIELKKLAYHYLVTYSAQEQEQSIMIVSTFVQDCSDRNPLIRALAVRTMCRIQIESVAENMVMPLKQCMEDPDPYVRKTAAIAVAKLYNIIPEIVENVGLLPMLVKLLNDENPMVISNSTAALFEINERRASPIFVLNEQNVSPILSAMSQCSGWVQTLLLDALSHYTPTSQDDAAFLIDRLIPFLKHSNPAVVIGSFKCIYQFLDVDKRTPQQIFPIIIPPFITLISSGEPEIQYVILRTMSLFVRKYPKALEKEIRVFFCKYNDPNYIKMEKIDIIVTIVSPSKVQLVLDEIEEYCNSVDVLFVRRAIDALGQIAFKIEPASRRCVDILVSQVSGKADYATEEAVIVCADILRKFPGHFEFIIEKVCSNLEVIKDSRAKAAAIWILGEYSSIIEHADVLLDPYLDVFHDETPEVQHQLLSAFIKVYVRYPEETRDQLQFILNEATKSTVLPDVKNRALIYWRLLSADQEFAKNAVTFTKTTEIHTALDYDSSALDVLIKNMGKVSGVLHLVPKDFVSLVKYVPEIEETEVEVAARDWKSVIFANSQNSMNSNGIIDAFADWEQDTLWIRVINKCGTPLDNFAVAINKNPFGLGLKSLPTFPEKLEFGDSFEIALQLVYDENLLNQQMTNGIQVALRTNMGTIYFSAPYLLGYITENTPEIDENTFETKWNEMNQNDLLGDFETSSQSSSEIQIQIDGLIAEDPVLRSRGLIIPVKKDGAIGVAFTLPKGKLFLAKLAQNGDKTLAAIRGERSLFTLIRNYAQSLFCAQ